VLGWGRRDIYARLFIALALLLGACANNTSGGLAPPAQIRGTFTPPVKHSPSARKKTTAVARPGSTVGPPKHRTPSGALATFDDLGSVGAMARAYAQATPARRLYYEIAYVEGNTPSQSSLDHIKTIFARDLAKPGGITVRLGAKIPKTQDEYSLADIAALSSRYRAHWSQGDTATMWLVSLNGSLAGAQGVLGVAYRASEVAVFPDQMDQATTAIVNYAAIERSVVTHETGHLLGLVNIAYESQYNHADPQHPGHSKYQTSVMYWAIDDISVAALLGRGPPDDFDRYDRADLATLRTK